MYPIYRLYKQFIEQRDREAKKVVNSVQEEWEVELEKMTSKFEKEMGKKKNNGEDVKLLTIKHNKEKVNMYTLSHMFTQFCLFMM